MRRLTVGIAVIVALVAAPSGWSWTWPVGGELLRPYSLGPDPYAAGQHRGVDVAGTVDEPVRAPGSGTVSFAGVVPGSGRTVTIQVGGYAVSLTHLGTISTSKGATVVEGAEIGTAGQSGDPEWPQPYVHLGIRVSSAADGYIDPGTLMPPRASAAPPSPAAPSAAPAEDNPSPTAVATGPEVTSPEAASPEARSSEVASPESASSKVTRPEGTPSGAAFSDLGHSSPCHPGRHECGRSSARDAAARRSARWRGERYRGVAPSHGGREGARAIGTAGGDIPPARHRCCSIRQPFGECVRHHRRTARASAPWR